MQFKINRSDCLGNKTVCTAVLTFPLSSVFMPLFSSGRFSHLFSAKPHFSSFSGFNSSYMSSKKPYPIIELLHPSLILPLSELFWRLSAILFLLNCAYFVGYIVQAHPMPCNGSVFPPVLSLCV